MPLTGPSQEPNPDNAGMTQSSDQIDGSTSTSPLISADPGLDLNPVATTQSRAKVIAFVDAGLANYQNLVSAISGGEDDPASIGSGMPEVIVLDSGGNGLQQITDSLSGRTGISAIHIFSHGFAGTLQLGRTRVAARELDSYSGQLATWSRSLNPGADILLYGCKVGAGPDGSSFISRMACLTGADVAASTDDTGSPLVRGNWHLETNTGPIEAGLPAAESRLDGYRFLLAALHWDGGGDGVSWNDPLNWSGDVLPGANDDVSIDAVAGDPMINISSGAGLVHVKSLNTSRPITILSGAILQASTIIQTSRNITLAGGTIDGGTVSVTGGARLLGTTSGGTLKNGVTLQGDPNLNQPPALDLTGGYGVVVTVSGGLTVNNATVSIGDANFPDWGMLSFTDSNPVLGGSGGAIVFVANSSYGYLNTLKVATGGGQLTIGPGITIHGSTGTIGYNSNNGGPANISFINQGTISADGSGGTITLNGTGWTNTGTVQAAAGGNLSLSGTWSNSNQMSISGGGTLSLGGAWSNSGVRAEPIGQN